MKTIVQKWGNSLGLRIPSLYAKELNLKDGSSVEIIHKENKLIIKPKSDSLEELLSKITNDNIHSSIETGESTGKEEW